MKSEDRKNAMKNHMKNFVPRSDNEFYESSRNDECNMAFWYMRLRDNMEYEKFKEIIPETEIYTVPVDLSINCCDGTFPGITKFAKYILRSTKLSQPFFMRGSLSSNKHNWVDSCYYNENDRVYDGKCYFTRNIAELLEFSWLGPNMPCTHIFLRKLIKTKHMFYAFNKMPITKEIRVIIDQNNNGKILKYWPFGAFENQVSYTDDDPCMSEEWIFDKLDDMYSEINPDELGHIFSESINIREATGTPYAWSIDWLQDINGKWWMIDMAISAKSYQNKEEGAVLYEKKNEDKL